MSLELELVLEDFPKEIELKDGFKCTLRPLQADDEEAFFQFFQAVPEQERMFIKHRVNDREVIRNWCQNIDLGRILPLLAVYQGQIIADGALHQQLGGWKSHIGRISVLVHPKFRGRGLARTIVSELLDLARHAGLEKAEAEFISEQERAIKTFSSLDFTQLMCLPNYVKDLKAVSHNYILMGIDLLTPEEYAGVGG